MRGKYRFRGRAAGSRPPAAGQERVLACKLGGKAGRDPRTPGRPTRRWLSEARGPRVGSVPRRDPLSASRWAPESNVYASLGVEAGDHGRSRLAVSLPRVAADACVPAGQQAKKRGRHAGS